MMNSYVLKILIGIGILLMNSSMGFAQESTSNFSYFVDTIQIQLGLTEQRSLANRAPTVVREKIMQNFCTVMNAIGTSDVPSYHNENTLTVYNPKYSVFVHIVCSPYGFTSAFTKNGLVDNEYFIKSDRRTLKIYGSDEPNEQNNDCNPIHDMAYCDIADVFSKLMHRILNDMFDSKQAAIYGGVHGAQDQASKINIASFVAQHFAGMQLCPQGNCVYPKTENRLLAYMNKGASLTRNMDILNWPYIHTMLTTKDQSQINCAYPPLTPEYHIFLCGFGSFENNSLSSFVTMIHNELFFYRLLLAHYMGWIQQERRLLPAYDVGLERSQLQVADRIRRTQQHLVWTQDAVQLSIKTLAEMHTTFPIHIGLLLYYEDLYRLRKELIKVVTPLYTLYDKLRNVQDASE